MSPYLAYLQVRTAATLTRLGFDVYDDDGAMSTEAAVITGVLVAIAVAAGIILIAKMRSNAEAIPDVVTPPGS